MTSMAPARSSRTAGRMWPSSTMPKRGRCASSWTARRPVWPQTGSRCRGTPVSTSALGPVAGFSTGPCCASACGAWPDPLQRWKRPSTCALRPQRSVQAWSPLGLGPRSAMRSTGGIWSLESKSSVLTALTLSRSRTSSFDSGPVSRQLLSFAQMPGESLPAIATSFALWVPEDVPPSSMPHALHWDTPPSFIEFLEEQFDFRIAGRAGWWHRRCRV
mmetsp:Transcript_34281/g.87053  ORF Transcript_34281/g.87053 Transcript_34281/m.87053 type:complete len:217 (+) Transcript_34281:1629-2279(+)